MDYLKAYRSLIYSQYLGQGVRITAGIVLPAAIFSHFGLLTQGIVMSLGAMAVSLTDLPGPIQHRRNGMIWCNLAIVVVSWLIGLVHDSPVGLGIFLLVGCFWFSFLGVYGSRANAIGVSAMLIMILTLEQPPSGWMGTGNPLLILGGGVWYTIFSLVLYRIRPYRLIQQALGDVIQATAAYLRSRAAFYAPDPDYDKIYRLLLEKQALLQAKQELIRELLFKSRKLVVESTQTSRILLMIFLDVVDLFERALTSLEDYPKLHRLFDSFGILDRFHSVIVHLAEELDEIGTSVQRGSPSVEASGLSQEIRELESFFLDFRDRNRNAENVDGFIALRHILESIQDIGDRLHTLARYTSYDPGLKPVQERLDLEQFISHQDHNPRILLENLGLSSNMFRHALRISVATLAGYLVSLWLPFGHSYWIMLTIIVILRPAYSLTKRRNLERLAGTVAGALIGVIVLYLIQDRMVLLGFLILFMILAYSFLRTKYLIGVLFMTPYVLLVFHLLTPAHFRDVVTDRLIDTGIGSGIAFFANLFLVPTWEHEQIRDYMTRLMEANIEYFQQVIFALAGQPVDDTRYKLARKNSLVNLANLSDAFNRMLSEPRSKQKNIRELQQFVALNHMLTSHIATLSSYQEGRNPSNAAEFARVADALLRGLGNSLEILKGKPLVKNGSSYREPLRAVNEKVSRLMEQRQSELKRGETDTDTRKQLSAVKPLADQLNFIGKIAGDLEKLGQSLYGNGISTPPA
jgi:uncharacterized membrane protein (TIGR01666 family)